MAPIIFHSIFPHAKEVIGKVIAKVAQYHTWIHWALSIDPFFPQMFVNTPVVIETIEFNN